MAHKYDSTMTDALKMVGGGIVGAGLALLLAPRSGKETRKDIVRFAKTVGSKTDKVVHDFADEVVEFADSVSDKAHEIFHSGKEMSLDAKKEMLSAIEKGQRKLEKEKHRLTRMMG